LLLPVFHCIKQFFASASCCTCAELWLTCLRRRLLSLLFLLLHEQLFLIPQVSFWEEAWFVMLFSAGVARKWKQHNLKQGHPKSTIAFGLTSPRFFFSSTSSATGREEEKGTLQFFRTGAGTIKAS